MMCRTPEIVHRGRMTVCLYPDRTPLSGYRLGCRCTTCRAAKAASKRRARQPLPPCTTPGCTDTCTRRNASHCAAHATARRAATAREQLDRRDFGRYGITRQDYDAMLTAQDGRCAICRATPTGQRLSIDHDHTCCPGPATSCGRCIRGLLCRACNTAIERIDTIDGWTDAARHYLDRITMQHGA